MIKRCQLFINSMDGGYALKSMVFAKGWKGEVQADLEQAQTHKHQHQI